MIRIRRRIPKETRAGDEDKVSLRLSRYGFSWTEREESVEEAIERGVRV
jgi:hypothetical protein